MIPGLKWIRVREIAMLALIGDCMISKKLTGPILSNLTMILIQSNTISNCAPSKKIVGTTFGHKV